MTALFTIRNGMRHLMPETIAYYAKRREFHGFNSVIDRADAERRNEVAMIEAGHAANLAAIASGKMAGRFMTPAGIECALVIAEGFRRRHIDAAQAAYDRAVARHETICARRAVFNAPNLDGDGQVRPLRLRPPLPHPQPPRDGCA